jgi:transcriptional regulator with XRE-family HTH domain
MARAATPSPLIPRDESQLIRELVGRNIARARLEAGLSQGQLAERIGRGPEHRAEVSTWERGRRLPSHKTLIAIAEVLRGTRDIGWFYSDDGDLSASASD